jgi:PPM family protein phosphatase
MKFSIYQESRQGQRKSNQDRIAYCYSRDALLMVVADGMGGHLHGEVAAQIAVQFITEAFQREAQPLLADPFLFLSHSVTNAHHAIVDYSFDRDMPETPRTTCVACVVQDGIAYWAHAGDSRLYQVRGNRILAQTRDHSRVQMLVDEGAITAEEAITHAQRNKIFSSLGGHTSPQIDFSRKTPLSKGDILLLCTDGVWGPLTREQLIGGLSHGPLSLTVPQLMDRAETAGGTYCDNLSLIAMTWEEADAPEVVSTQTLALDHFTTQMEGFGKSRLPPGAANLSDEEIERAISEINSAIKKFSR